MSREQRRIVEAEITSCCVNKVNKAICLIKEQGIAVFFGGNIKLLLFRSGAI